MANQPQPAARPPLNVADHLLHDLSLFHRILLPVGPGVSPISGPDLVRLQLIPNT